MSGYDLLRARLTYDAGGNEPTQENINNQNKYRSFRASMTNAEQLEHIHIGTYYDGDLQFNSSIVDCEINPDKIAESYDQKKISILYENLHAAGLYELMGGTIIHWPRLGHLEIEDQEEIKTMDHGNCLHSKNNAYWIVLERDLEEKAYARGRIRRCNYEIEADGHKYKIALIGPQEIGLEWNNAHNIWNNKLNYSPHFYVTKDEITNDFFTRFRKVKFDGHNWKVVVVDRYTLDGIIKVYIDEDFDNPDEEDQIIIEEITDVELQKKEESETPEIIGTNIIHPYDEGIEYHVNKNTTDGLFVVSSNKVKIIEQNETSCVLNVLTGRSGEVELRYEVDGSAIARLPLTIKSL